VTGTRADYGVLYWLIREIKDDKGSELQIIATGSHLSPEFGLTYKVIEEDGFEINEKVEMLLSSDTAIGVTKSLGLAVIGFAESLARLKPDILVVLGDRYEILAAAQAAMIAKIPVAHIAGGDTTEGAFDEAIRHSITKMSHLHFVTNELAARRVKQLGENPQYIFNVGSPGIDYIKRVQLLDRTALEREIDFKFKEKNLLVTFHPETLGQVSAADQFAEVLKALDSLDPNIGILFTKANADTHSRDINRMIDDYATRRQAAKAYASLGQLRYLSAVAQVDMVVGNSSSGIGEVPSFKKATVNIGDRQKGRLQAPSVVNCAPKVQEIKHAIDTAFNMDCSKVENPYGDGNSSVSILSVLKRIPDYKVLIRKQFFMLEN